MSLPPPLRVDLRLRNNRLIRAREELGFATASAFARSIGMCITVYCAYETLLTNPRSRRDGTWKPTAIKIAEALATTPEDLWPVALERVQRRKLSVELEPPMIDALPPPEQPDEAFEATDARRRLAAAMDRLTPCEYRIVAAHFGLDGDDEQSLEQIAAIHPYQLSRGRVSQLKQRALVKLRKALGNDDNG